MLFSKDLIRITYIMKDSSMINCLHVSSFIVSYTCSLMYCAVGDFQVKLFPEVPTLTNGRNPVFPALSKKVEIKYSLTQGRYAVAAEDIKVGDYLCTEKPYAAVLICEAFGTHCQNCFIV